MAEQFPDWRKQQDLEAASGAISSAWDSATCASHLRRVDDNNLNIEPLIALKQRLECEGLYFEGDSFERALLLLVVEYTWPTFAALPVHPKVVALLRSELRRLSSRDSHPLPLGSSNFLAWAKISTQRRFPAGPMDWEISGIPLSWIPKAGLGGAFRFSYFLARELGGVKPVFFMHVGLRPRNRALILETEVMRAYYRMAWSLKHWPAMKGIVAHGWFHDPEAVRQNPHLAFMNKPFLEYGGRVFRMEVAKPDSGFGEHNPSRVRQYQAGTLHYHMYAAVWAREHALEWVAKTSKYGD